LRHHLHGMRRREVRGRVWRLKLCNTGCNDFVFPFMLEFCEDILCHPILFKFVLNRRNNIVYDSPIYGGLIEKCYPTELLLDDNR